ncbi:MAG: phenylalanine--tRNA ligase subunit beta [Gemmatimonadetes bacterium]|nr:phenylalanine--tRNA ligase subunit beta [Gemmatimonadota bacterium]
MNVSYNWLRALAPSITATPSELADALAMRGAPVDELVELSAGIGDVVIARVDEVRQHPNADRLRLCSVDAGSGARLQVVCGAPNVEAGGYYPFAPIGSSLPGGVEIRKAKLRGELSEGMLCSARELGLGRDHAGLMALSGSEWQLGASLVDQLGLNDTRLIVDVTPNRPDLLSHVGVARELAPGGVADITLRPFSAEPPALATRNAGGDHGEMEGIRVVIEDAVGCPRYTAAIVRGVRVGPSPEWLATRLRSVGLRPINNLVDATNYVLHEMGQPLHAFDLDRLGGGEIRVRRARPGETLRTLDGVERELTAEILVIADAERAVALAGVMGGEESEVTAGTTNLLIECASFEPQRVRKAARFLGLSTDASHRFERGVDPELQLPTLSRVVDLILAIAGGSPEPTLLEVGSGSAPRMIVPLRLERVTRLLGIELDESEIERLLEPIGFVMEAGADGLAVRVPGYRPDVTREVDLIEEIARRRGYASFPEQLAPFRPTTVPEDPLVPVLRRVRETFTRWGFLEARTAGFAPAADSRVPLLNPLSSEESHLRDAVLPGLLRRVEHNWAHGVRNVRLYEIGTAFLPAPGETVPREEIRVAAAFTGLSEPLHWSGPGRSYDLWDLKALLEELAATLGAAAPQPATVGGATGLLDAVEGFEVSGVGAVRAEAGAVLASSVDSPAWADRLFGLEITLSAADVASIRYAPLPEYPAVERDLALLVPQGTAAAELERVIRSAAGTLLEEVGPFDLYAGAGIPEGTRSLAWRLRFRRPDRTLTDAEVDRSVDGVLRALEELNVSRR